MSGQVITNFKKIMKSVSEVLGETQIHASAALSKFTRSNSISLSENSS